MYGFEFSSQSQNSPELSSAQNCFKMTLTIANIIFLVRGTGAERECDDWERNGL
jgi:hypothetical protein